MRKNTFKIMVALAAIVGGAQAQTLSVQPTEAQTGEQTELVVSLTGGTAMTALQFNLQLPEGVTLDETAIAKGEAAGGHTLSISTLDGGDRLFVLYSMNLDTFGDGCLLRLPVTAPTEAGTFSGRLYTVRTASVGGGEVVSHTAQDAAFTVTVQETATQGIYIETDMTVQFPIDWQGWTGATGYVGWAAPEVTTNDGRQTAACERFDGGQATTGTVFNRTLTGLTNGTYRIELYGAAASTKGRDTGIDTEMTDDDEGDETAVYLYAKTASGTVKQYIPVHWATDFNGSGIATATLNKVKVTDGTVEIGMYGEKKYTNWHVVQIKGVTALVDAEELHANTISRAQAALQDEAYAAVSGQERTALSQAIANNATVAERTAEAYKTTVTALETAIKTFTDAKVNYEAFAAAKTLVEGRTYAYAAEAKQTAAETAASATAVSAADAVAKTEALLTAYRQYAESGAMLEGVEGSEDVTATYIKNPKAAESIDATVWQTVLGDGSGGSISIREDEPWTDGNGNATHRYFDGGDWGASAWNVTFRQDLTLPAGRYLLTALGRSSQDVTLTLFAGETTAEMAHIGASGGLFNRGWEQTSVEFELTEENTVSIGVKGVTTKQHNWMSYSDFRLTQFPKNTDSNDISIIKTEKRHTGDHDIVYDLTGRRLMKTPRKGIYVKNGRKVVMK